MFPDAHVPRQHGQRRGGRAVPGAPVGALPRRARRPRLPAAATPPLPAAAVPGY